ncbi:hypothetical protein B1J92_I05764g [Nakaseomyces glabratus]|nr:transcription factor nrm1 [Nakaseomyces glabratus]OXB42439.1 hypothetical protein B1J91_I05764g [Nakaseomyces glabratus]OXB47738.1 hypothetical protein B1J92_I05764g [Nakaseomyces glabratus]
MVMSLERLPLQEYTKSAMNNLATSGPVIMTSLTEGSSLSKNSVGMGLGMKLPSIHSLINQKNSYNPFQTTLHSKSFSVGDPIKANNSKPLGVTLTSTDSNKRLNTSISALLTDNKSPGKANKPETEKEAMNHLPQEDTVDKAHYTELSKKLQIRLQLAYYKYRTKQEHVKFNELKALHSSKPKKASKKNTKRRKLVVSHGNFKTPAKRKEHKLYTTNTHNLQDVSTDISMSSSTSSLMSKRDSSLQFHDSNDTTNDFTTPIRNANKRHLGQKQDTPMSVKAAKSLIFLYSSKV